MAVNLSPFSFCASVRVWISKLPIASLTSVTVLLNCYLTIITDVK